ncbi:hypothetical protein HPP92_009283 [Vanilla planifolia]|uniref:RNA helicase n=1 Tax=Vanilla planifolia TaxID=51239 RepID=A0A835RJ14_VANPL|nr:hypothetical protein HPP92_009283 [Vanilla planifolia]
MLAQLPRLTNSIRDHFDVDEAYLQRKKIIQNLKSRRPRGDSELARRLVPRWDEVSNDVQQAYKQFIASLRELTDGASASEEFQEVASLVYGLFCAPDVDIERQLSEKKPELQSLVGYTVPDSSLHKVAELAHRLYMLQCEGHDIAHMQTQTEILDGCGDKFPEFGSDITFQVPARFLVETYLENGVSRDDFVNSTPNDGKHLMHAHRPLKSGRDVVNLRMLKDACEEIFNQGNTELSGDDLAMTLSRILLSNKAGDEIAGDLLDLVGDGAFEVVQNLLSNRKLLVESINHGLFILKSEKMASNSQARRPSYGTQVTVQTESERQMDKLRRKEEKRHKRGLEHGDVQDIAADSFSSLLMASEKKQPFDDLVGTGQGSSSFSVNSLPQGTVRFYRGNYEEVRVPPTPTAPMGPDEKLIEISELDDFAQAAFHGYKSLNRIQSHIFHTTYYSNENILVCAPTGAGKTNIAMIAVLHEIKQHFRNGILHKEEFKIVYVAPMKALAAEVTATFSHRLSPLSLVVKELTGDMQLSKYELEQTQMIVTTPEKWDVITRKSSDMSLSVLVKLLIIDEVHLLNDDRGPVIEALVARTLRQVESTQSMIRIIGLSATLPNYLEVAQFLRVNAETGLFFFDSSYRPVPLAQQYIGISEKDFIKRNELYNKLCFEKVVESMKQGHQAMVFVHSRKDTGKVARVLVELAQNTGNLELFRNEDDPQFPFVKKEVSKSRNRELVQLFDYGFGIHHAGMLRADRSLTERLFSARHLNVLVCTATLAWGVNLPAHTVVIKGTQLYDPKVGGWRDLGMLDVMQIFGRAGRPQFDKSGEGIIITSHDKLAYYLRLLTSQLPIESQFISSLKDNLNAEVALGTVTNIKEACAWLGYTYLFIRMKTNPLVYGVAWDEVIADPSLASKQRSLVVDAARSLDKAKMMRFDEKSGNFYCTELGRIASHFYLQYSSVETYNEMLRRHMSDSEVINMVAHSSEFENIVVREEEQEELENLCNGFCPLEVKVHISRASIDSFSLISDAAYISASLGRIMHALFEICLRRGWCQMSSLMLDYCKAVDRQIWPHQHPFRQFEKDLPAEVLRKLEEKGADLDHLLEMEEKEIGALIRYAPGGKVDVLLTPDFAWKDRFHGASERWWIFVEDSENDHIYHSELFLMTKKMASGESQKISFTVPIFEPHPPQYYIRAVSESWLHSESLYTVSFRNLTLPETQLSHTELLDLKPLPVSSLGNQAYEKLYKFSHFNPIQTQVFHVLYHTASNVLLGAPTGSGKTISAELAMLHIFNTQPDMKVEMTGDFTPDLMALLSADIIISTPEKWDGISRSWHSRAYVTKVGLMILDEIHLLGADRGPILEVIVSRMRYISSQTERTVRFVGLSTALANARQFLFLFHLRRQTRLTALDLIQLAAADENPRQFLNMPDEEVEMILVCTSTLAWGVNLPAHLVIIKGTEYYDGKTKRYVDFPITDILQMMGRAGRPQFDQHGKAVILVHEPKKSFYKKFLYEPFPVESNLREHMHDHINAEIVSGTICHKEDAVHYLTWTYLFRRLVMNPSYYGLEDTHTKSINAYLSRLVQNTFEDLEDSGCIKVDENNVVPLMLGSIASQYYLSYMTVSMFASNIGPDTSLEVFLHILSGAAEYDELPVRHNEEILNGTLSKRVPHLVDEDHLDDPHVKANLLLQGLCYGKDSSLWMLPSMSDNILSHLNQLDIFSIKQLLEFSNSKLYMLLEKASALEVYEELLNFPRVKVKVNLSKDDAKDSASTFLNIRLAKTKKTSSSRAFVPRYPKIKDEAWWLVLGNVSTSELYALKRISFSDRLVTKMELPSMHINLQETKLFLISDCYLGLEQEIAIG